MQSKKWSENESNGTAWQNRSRNKLKTGGLASIPNTVTHYVYTDVTFPISNLTCGMKKSDWIRNLKLSANWQDLVCNTFSLGHTV